MPKVTLDVLELRSTMHDLLDVALDRLIKDFATDEAEEDPDDVPHQQQEPDEDFEFDEPEETMRSLAYIPEDQFFEEDPPSEDIEDEPAKDKDFEEYLGQFDDEMT